MTLADTTERPHAIAMSRPGRDARVDVLRALALLMIFIDHVPKNSLNLFTLHNFGFCDAAEVFVTLAGFSAMAAYGSKFEGDGVLRTLARMGERCLRIYVAHVLLVLLTVVVVLYWTAHFRVQPVAIAPLLQLGWPGIVQALSLRALPGYLDILPLYIVLLAAFPLVYLLMRRHVGLALGASVAVWAAANLYAGLNLPNVLDGKGWYFNPFTWQLLFVAGAALSVLMRRHGDVLPRQPWLLALSWTYLGFSLLQGGNWQDWGLPSLRPLGMGPPEKSLLSPWRIADIAALLYVLLSSPAVVRATRSYPARMLALCGRHSLEVFVVGCTCALVARLATRTFGAPLAMQIAINLVGIGVMWATAAQREHSRKRKYRDRQISTRECEESGFRTEDFGVYRAG